MTIFEQAKARADAVAPAPADQPLTAAATSFGFGLFVIAAFVVLQWLGLPGWAAWLAAALAYGAIAWADCRLGWNSHRREYREALETLKQEAGPPSIH